MPRSPPCRGPSPAEGRTPDAAHRRKSVPHVARHSVRVHRQRRRDIRFDRRRLGSGKNLPGRLHDRSRRNIRSINWKKNKGYPTREHREAVMRYGSRLITGYPSAAISPSRICSAIGSKQRSPDRRSPTPRRTNRDGQPAGCPTNGRAKRRSAEKPERRKLPNREKIQAELILQASRTVFGHRHRKKIAEYLLTKGYSRIVYLFRKRHGRRRSDSPPLSDHPIELFTFSPRFARYSVRAKTEL